jgi:hypothetical protein
VGGALIAGVDADGAHTEDPLTQRHGQLQITDTIEQHFADFQIEKTALAEQTILTETIPGEGQGHTQKTLSVIPQVFNIILSHSMSLLGFSFIVYLR